MRVLVVDDHAVVREGVRHILSKAGDVASVDEACDGLEGLEMAREYDYDAILLDISLPTMNGIDVLKHIMGEKPHAGVIMFTMYPESQFAVRALRSGASGYLTKEHNPEELMSAVRQVAGGGRYITASLASRLADALNTRAEHPHEWLSDREFQVLRGLGASKSVTQISEELGLSVKTVSTYRTRLLRKMGMTSNSEIAQYVIREGLIEQ